MNLNPAGFSKSDMSSSWEEVNPAGFSKSDMSSSWEEVTLRDNYSDRIPKAKVRELSQVFLNPFRCKIAVLLDKIEVTSCSLISERLYAEHGK